MEPIILTLHGTPIPKGRPRAFKDRAGNIRTHTPAPTSHAENSWRDIFISSGMPPFPPGTPLALHVLFLLPRPRSLPRKQIRPVSRPDLDNLVKLVTDALEGLAYHNDSAIVSITTEKRYVAFPDFARTEITITEAT